MVTQEAKAGFLASSCVNNRCARVCYIPLKEDESKNKPRLRQFNRRHTTVSIPKPAKVPSLTETLELGDQLPFHRGGCF